MRKAINVFSLALLTILVWTCGIFALEWEYIYEGDILPDDPALGDKAAGVYKTAGINTSDVCDITPAGELLSRDSDSSTLRKTIAHGSSVV